MLKRHITEDQIHDNDDNEDDDDDDDNEDNVAQDKDAHYLIQSLKEQLQMKEQAIIHLQHEKKMIERKCAQLQLSHDEMEEEMVGLRHRFLGLMPCIDDNTVDTYKQFSHP